MSRTRASVQTWNARWWRWSADVPVMFPCIFQSLSILLAPSRNFDAFCLFLHQLFLVQWLPPQFVLPQPARRLYLDVSLVFSVCCQHTSMSSVTTRVIFHFTSFFTYDHLLTTAFCLWKSSQHPIHIWRRCHTCYMVRVRSWQFRSSCAW